MKTRTKILIVIFLAVLWIWVIDAYSKNKPTGDPLECPALKVWYLAYNDEYFDGMLPKNAVVDYGDARGAMAMTVKREGVFYVTLEERYNLAASVAHETLLHESCHIVTWSEFDEHGKRWYDCMHRIYAKGAFEGLL
jgi:hypothetical protein